ncbi:hypothetical protein B0J12DRAFT_56901 [Macrophomina phaseolina]|uniref:Uncharacterized protein n=1 Tax=Macrophomina phaseolina TaxID=35725 RepID=A0ABQ8GET9_9PEZI|nr:hypothetical protein B0J12DRAFT_56901 [Macrophomina phaseolina]
MRSITAEQRAALVRGLSELAEALRPLDTSLSQHVAQFVTLCDREDSGFSILQKALSSVQVPASWNADSATPGSTQSCVQTSEASSNTTPNEINPGSEAPSNPAPSTSGALNGMNSVRKKRNSDQPIIEFFQTYETSNNQRLSEKSVNTLSGLALKIPHEEKYLDDFESSYKKDPLSFWFNGHTNSSAGEGNLHVISYIFHDFDNTECLSLVRRRLILQLLSEQVDEEGKRLRETEVSRHGQTYRSWALQRVAEALSHEHPHFKKSRFKRAALAGSKWRRLRLGMCIGLANMGRAYMGILLNMLRAV